MQILLLDNHPQYKLVCEYRKGFRGANVLEILTRSRRERGIRGRDNSSVECGCGGVVDEKKVRYFEDEGVVGGNGW